MYSHNAVKEKGKRRFPLPSFWTIIIVMYSLTLPRSPKDAMLEAAGRIGGRSKDKGMEPLPTYQTPDHSTQVLMDDPNAWNPNATPY